MMHPDSPHPEACQQRAYLHTTFSERALCLPEALLALQAKKMVLQCAR